MPDTMRTVTIALSEATRARLRRNALLDIAATAEDLERAAGADEPTFDGLAAVGCHLDALDRARQALEALGCVDGPDEAATVTVCAAALAPVVDSAIRRLHYDIGECEMESVEQMRDLAATWQALEDLSGMLADTKEVAA